MSDKHRSEIQKPVKNTLLSGASHGFPFENFQGSSLLIPVTQDSPSVLNDSICDAKKLGTKDLTNSENLAHLTEAIDLTTLADTPNTNELKDTPPTASQGYTGIFSSFFSGGSQKKQEFDGSKQKNSDQSSASFVSSPVQSSSSFMTVPPVQSFTPALQVPAVVTEHPSNDTSSKGVAVSQSEGQPRSNFEIFSAPSNTPPKSVFSKPDIAKEFNQCEQNVIQSFPNASATSKADLDLSGQTSITDIGFESFRNYAPGNMHSSIIVTKAQSAIDLIGEGLREDPLGNSKTFSNSAELRSSASQFYQTRMRSADSITPLQSPPYGVSSLTAPPMSSGAGTRNYRRDHHKRLAYAPVPGLTSNTAVSSSYLQPCENFSALTSVSSSALMTPFEVLRPPLSGSLSQPALSAAEIKSSSNLLSNSSASFVNPLQNFFYSNSTTTFDANLQSAVQHVESSQTEAAIPSYYPSSNAQIASSQNVISAVNFSSHIFQTTNSLVSAPLPPSSQMRSTYTVSPHSIHPPIMSTREQTQLPISTTHVERSPSPTVIPASFNNLANLGNSGIIYRPVYHHWFIRAEVKDSKEIWQPFSMTDSLALEQAFNSDKLTPETVIPTDGGRYDVNITNRIRTSVYWEEKPKTVRRCSWFYKNTTESRLHPYDENTAYNLEEEYKKAVTTNSWSRKVDLPTGDHVIMYGPNSMALFQNTPQTPEGWEAEPDYTQAEQRRPKIVKRGVLDDFDIDEGESPIVDHLIFVVHGIGSVCDFRFRTIEEAGIKCKNLLDNMITGDDLDEFLPVNIKIGKVDGFRAKSIQLIKSHFRTSVESGVVNRVEVLPVSWHSHLHGENTGVDKKLQTITLKSIPRLRHFTNDTLLDILFYTSPVYCQNIVQQVGREINNLYARFRARNPSFAGGVSLVGHSLGSLILFDMLCHQKPPSPRMKHIQEESKATASQVQHSVTTTVSPDKKKRSLSRNVSYVIGNAGTGQPFIEYPQLSFQPLAFFAMGSPIGMFVTVRGIDSLGLDFCLPTCSRFFNIFHPFDPVAYRIEALVNPDFAEKRPVLIPHHKGRKRMHLELKETMARVGADLKQRLVDSVRSTWNTVYQLTMFGRADDGLEQEVDQVIEKQLERQRTESVGNDINENEETDFNAGRLNQGRRIDYVLQEAPLESFNEYVSALTSHVIYWDSEDTMLLILNEIYGSMGISTYNHHNSISNLQEPPSSAVPDPSSIPSTSTGYRQPPSYGFK